MDTNKFTEKKPGKLVRVNILGQEDWAFIPDDLPTNMTFSDDIWLLLSEARQEIGKLDGAGMRMSNYELLLRPLQRNEALKSSSLEGTFATPEELLLLEMEPGESKSRQSLTSPAREVMNYGKALRLGQELLNKIPISLRLIKDLHKELLSGGVRGDESNPGNFRQSQVHIGSGRRFVPPPYNEALKCINKLENYIHKPSRIDPLIRCFLVHYQFETIHPFIDGNGRTGRLLLSLMIFTLLKLEKPWLYLSAFFDKSKDEYIENLFNVSAKGDWEAWIIYCLQATIYQAKDAVTRLDRMLKLKESFFERLAIEKPTFRCHQIINYIFDISPMINIPWLCKKLEVPYPTAKRDVDLLIRLGILKTFRLSHPKAFYSPEILDAVYRDVKLN
jgi:Fic family protein